MIWIAIAAGAIACAIATAAVVLLGAPAHEVVPVAIGGAVEEQPIRRPGKRAKKNPMAAFFSDHMARPHAFPIEASAGGGREVIPDWWNNPPPLTAGEIAYLRYFSAISWQLPETSWSKVWDTETDRVGNTDRFFGSFAGYAVSALMMRLPAYTGLTKKLLSSFIEHVLDRQSWLYVHMFWKNKPWYPDPVAHENIMYSGHLLQLMATYEAMTGDDRFRTKGFDFVWDERTRFHYDLQSLVDITVKQMHESPSGGVPCEPGIIFFSCNDHPHIALKLMKGMGLGDYTAEHDKWEKFALNGFYDNLGGGAIKIAYHLGGKVFSKIGYPGMDGWSLVYYQPWAADPEVPNAIWRLARKNIRWTDFGGPAWARKPRFPGPSAYVSYVYAMVQEILAPEPTASFLYAAAVMCDDLPTALYLREILDSQYVVEDNGRRFLNLDKRVQIGTTANMLMGLAHENGSSLRHLVQRPPPRAYFKGPLVEEVLPEDAAVYQAFRNGTSLVVEVESAQPIAIRLANVAAVERVEGVPPSSWSFSGGTLRVDRGGRYVLTIVPG